MFLGLSCISYNKIFLEKCTGITVFMNPSSRINECASLSQVLLKLFSYCVKVKINRQQLVKPEMNTLNVMLGTLNLVSEFQ